MIKHVNAFNRIIAFIVIFILMFALSACKQKNTHSGLLDAPSSKPNASTTAKAVTLPYSAKDVLNPYDAETKQNQELSKLLFDPLFILKDDFTVDHRIAESYIFEANKCTVKIRTITFTDGSLVTADDIIYSFNKARAGTVYSSQLQHITSCIAVDGTTVIFSQNRLDPNMVNLLDFPIIKAGTSDLKDENSRTVPPIGCGRYTFSKENESLIANTSYYRTKIKLNQIKLIDCPDDESLQHHIATGNITTVYSDLVDGVIPKKSGTPVKTTQTNLVFLGVNCNNGLLRSTKLRLALSSALDRQQLCDNGFYGYADEATDIFPSAWSRVKDYESLNKNQNLKQTVAYLEEIGYNRKDADGFYIDQSGNRLSLTLLCNDQNSYHSACSELIESHLNKCGIEIKIKQLEWSQYLSSLQQGNFDLYIGEIKLNKSLYVRDILNPSVIYGYPIESDSLSKFDDYYNGTSDIMVAISSFATELPFIPICYKNGVTISSSWLEKHIDFSLSDVYCGIENYN